MIIAPVKQFLLDYKINNPSDTDTHYVRAVVKNSITGATIETLDLTDNGSGYFSKEWTTPNDASGNGFQVSVLITVYDDAGYTSESLIYGTTLQTYIIRDLAGPRLGIGGAGAGMRSEIDYEKLEKLIRKVISEIKFPEINIPVQEFPEPYDDSKVMAGIKKIQESIHEPPADRTEEIVQMLMNGFKDAEKTDDELHEFVKKTLEKVKSDTEETKLYVRDGLANMKPVQQIRSEERVRKLLDEDVVPIPEPRKIMLAELLR